jgi:hypothetical protein
MSSVDATASATRPSERSEPRLDNRFFAVVLAAMFAVLITMLGGFVGEMNGQHAPKVAADAQRSPATALVMVDSRAGHN